MGRRPIRKGKDSRAEAGAGAKGKAHRELRDRSKDSSILYKTGEIPKLRGGGIAFKLALVITAVILLIMIVVGVVMYKVMAGALDEQIDAGGVVTARLFAAPDQESWSIGYGVPETEHLNKDEIKRREYNRNRLIFVRTRHPSQLLNATITRETREIVWRDSFMDTKSKAPQWKPTGRTNQVHDVSVEYGWLEIDSTDHSARSYTAPIRNYMDEVTGYATVYISEDLIDERKKSLAGTLVVLFVLFVALGATLAFYVGRKITEPIQSLIEDISIVAGGNLNHHTPARSKDEIGLVARTFDRMTRNLQDAQSREIELAAQKHQIAVAQEVQANLLPSRIPEVDGYEILAYYRSSREVDGTYYDAVQYPDGKVGIMVAAASGKGVPAAMVITMARSFIRSLVNRIADPVELLKETNRLLSPDLRAGMYVELLMALFDPAEHRVSMVSAGPTALMKYDAAEKKLKLIHGEGIALGFDKGPIFERSLKETIIDLAPGDRLVLNTPGLLTIKNASGQEVGIKGFGSLVNRMAEQDGERFVSGVVQAMDHFAGRDVQDTDITFITLRRGTA